MPGNETPYSFRSQKSATSSVSTRHMTQVRRPGPLVCPIPGCRDTSVNPRLREEGDASCCLSGKNQQKGDVALTQDDALFRFRKRVFALAEEIGVAGACKAMGIHRSTYYRWRNQVLRYGIDILHPRERRPPRKPNSTSPRSRNGSWPSLLLIPPSDPSAQPTSLVAPSGAGSGSAPTACTRSFRRHGLNTKIKRLGLVAGYAAPPEGIEKTPQLQRHIDVDHPGELVQMDCFSIGRLTGAKGTCWQYTAIDVASGFMWAELHLTPKNPSARCWTWPWRAELPRTSQPGGGGSRRSPPTTPQSSVPRSSKRRCGRPMLDTSSSGRAVRSPTATSSGANRRSWRSAGNRHSLAI